MSDRVSRIILLCEDEAHERLTKSFLKQCGFKNLERLVHAIVAGRMVRGGNVHWVLKEFPKQLHACRQRHKRAKTMLVVMVDADELTGAERRKQLLDRLDESVYAKLSEKDPAVLLIPKRHVETWLCALLGRTVTEDEDSKKRIKPKKADYRQAAQTLFDWSRPNATPGATCVPSLGTHASNEINIRTQCNTRCNLRAVSAIGISGLGENWSTNRLIRRVFPLQSVHFS